MNIVIDNDLGFMQSDENLTKFFFGAHKIINVYKGGSPVSSERLKIVQQNFIDREYIKVRGYERILFGTGVSVQVPDNQQLLFFPINEVAVRKGLSMVVPQIVDKNYTFEIEVLLCNTNQYLTTINKDEAICVANLVNIDNFFLQRVKELSKKI